MRDYSRRGRDSDLLYGIVVSATAGAAVVDIDGTQHPDVLVSSGRTLPVDDVVAVLREGRRLIALASWAPTGVRFVGRSARIAVADSSQTLLVPPAGTVSTDYLLVHSYGLQNSIDGLYGTGLGYFYGPRGTGDLVMRQSGGTDIPIGGNCTYLCLAFRNVGGADVNSYTAPNPVRNVFNTANVPAGRPSGGRHVAFLGALHFTGGQTVQLDPDDVTGFQIIDPWPTTAYQFDHIAYVGDTDVTPFPSTTVPFTQSSGTPSFIQFKQWVVYLWPPQ